MHFTTRDGLRIEGEIDVPTDPRSGVVLCHPHPLHGGSMRSVVIGALWQALPGRGVACLRFNFRGVEGSEGVHGGGEGEQLDATAALDTLREALPGSRPIAVVGWSFGGDVALSVGAEAHAGWLAIAPPLKFGAAAATASPDPRPKQIVLAQHDQYRPPAEVEAEVAGWVNARVEVVGGADHYFIGRTGRLVEAADRFVTGLSPLDE